MEENLTLSAVLGLKVDPLGNPVVVDWCPREPCPFAPGPQHRHSLVLSEERLAYVDWYVSRLMKERASSC